MKMFTTSYKIFFIFCFFIFMFYSSNAISEQIYTVKSGDSLSKIAKKMYNDEGKWLLIYRENRNKIKKDGNLIKVGAKITIPEIKNMNANIAKQVAYDDHNVKKNSKVIHLVTGDDYEPFTSKTMPQKGMFTEIVKKIFYRLDYKVKIDFMNWKTGFDLTYKRGIYDGTFPYLFNKERSKKFYYSKPIYEMMILAFINKNSNIVYTMDEDLQGKKLCRPKGYYTHDIQKYIDNNVIDFIQPENIEDCFQMLKNNEVDIVSVNEMTGNTQITKMGYKGDIVPADKIMSIQTLHVIFPKSTSNGRILKYKFDKELDKMQNSGELNEIRMRHVNYYYDHLESQKESSDGNDTADNESSDGNDTADNIEEDLDSPIRSGEDMQNTD